MIQRESNLSTLAAFLKKVGLRVLEVLVKDVTWPKPTSQADDARSIIRLAMHGSHLLGNFGSPT